MKHKKLTLLLAIFMLMLLVTSCNMNMAEGSLETDKSSIYQRSEVKYCKITAENVRVRKGIGDKYNTIKTLQKGDKIKVLSEIGNWYVVRLDDNQLGAIKSNNATPITESEGQKEQPENNIDKNRERTPEEQDTSNRREENEVEGDEPSENEPINEPTPGGDNPVDEPEEQTQPDSPQNKDDKYDIEPADSLNTMERNMVDRVNEERRKNDLSPLAIDYKLTKVARIKAQDMVDNDYFSHYSPTYGSPFDMMDKFGIEYLQAAENLAGNASVEKAHNSLMGSSGHRQNILNPGFTHIGLGVKASDRYGYIFVQMFIKK